MKFVIAAVIIVSLIAGTAYFFLSSGFKKAPQKPKDITLTVYGLWEDEAVIKPAVDEFKKINPNVTINYKFQSSQNYRTRVSTQISENQGPDIFMIHNSWLPMFLKTLLITSAPENVFTMQEYQKLYYPIIADSFTKDGKIYGVPRGIDGLVLFYNEEIISSAGITPPQTWDQFRDAAIKATVTEEGGKIKTAGAALGSVGNVDHWQDIIGLLFSQQPGAKLDSPNSQEGVDILKFYTDFTIDPKKRVWDRTWEASTQAFAAGKLAFYFAPSWKAHELRQINPQLKFKMIPPPQLPGKKVGYASFWGFAVSSKSQFKEEAWQFLKFFTNDQTEKLLYQEASKSRLFGIPYANVSLQPELVNDPLSGAVISQAPFFKSGYLVSSTRDQGLNEAISKYYEDALNAVLGGSDPGNVLETASKGIVKVLNDFVNASPVASGQK